jgi:hypothetical protein
MKQRVSNLIPKGKGQNIAEFYKNGKSSVGIFAKYAKEGGHKHSMVKCACCNMLVPGIIVDTGGIKDPIPLHMPCRACDKWIGHLELENYQVLDGMCLECFEEEAQ